MSYNSSPEPSLATITLGSATSWDDCYAADKATPTPIPKPTSTSSEDGGKKVASNPETASQPDVGPTPLNKPQPVDSANPADEPPESTDAKTSPLMINEPEVDPKFCFHDSNITVQASAASPNVAQTFASYDRSIYYQAGESLFRVHEFKLMEFRGLKPLIRAAQRDLEGRKILKLTATAEDIHNVFAVLYSSAYASQPFNVTTLKSTLRLSTIYNHDQLRTFAICKLGAFTLPPIERFELSRDCGVESWMSKALDDLCWREEPLTVKEGEVLGMKQFAEVAARREGVKFERGSRVMLSTNVPAPTRNVAEAAKQTAPTSSGQPAPAPVPMPTSVPGLFSRNWTTLASSSPAVASSPPAFSGFGFGRAAASTAPTYTPTRQLSLFDGMAPALTSDSKSQAQVPKPSSSSTRPQVIIGVTGNNHQDEKV